MRKVIFQMLVTLDGRFEGPERDISWHNVDDEFNAYAIDTLRNVDTLLFGRVTYELMAAYWPTAEAIKDDPIVARSMNALPKIVFSRSDIVPIILCFIFDLLGFIFFQKFF